MKWLKPLLIIAVVLVFCVQVLHVDGSTIGNVIGQGLSQMAGLFGGALSGLAPKAVG